MDTLKIVSQGSAGVFVWWLEWVPPFIQFCISVAVLVHLILQIKDKLTKEK